MNESTAAENAAKTPQWRPLTSRQRRVLGVLVEKAKTTPDAYPMTLNALTTGCNQKSNRDPQMNLSADDVEEVLEELRGMGAVAEVHAGGRVPKYRHYAYDWLGVDKDEIAVVTELLLRGEQTVGELRGRAARMADIADLGALRPVLQSLIEKRLLVPLSPEGRGQVVTHGLYPDSELAQIKARVVSAPVETSSYDRAPQREMAPTRSAPVDTGLHDELAQLREELAELRSRVEQLEQQVNG